MFCDSFYQRFNRPEYIEPDPLQLVRPHESVADREIVGFIAASLALGRVASIIAASRRVLVAIPNPVSDLMSMSTGEIRERLGRWYYRFFTVEHMVGLLTALKRTLESDGSLEALIARGAGARPQTSPCTQDEVPWGRTLLGLSELVQTLRYRADGALSDTLLLADPRRGSSCKRHMLFLRWMVRHDAVDPGGWRVLRPSELLVPLDVHMLSVARRLHLTSRQTASLAATIEVTNGFRAVNAADPVRYDFCLTRPGIHPRLGWEHHDVQFAATNLMRTVHV